MAVRQQKELAIHRTNRYPESQMRRKHKAVTRKGSFTDYLVGFLASKSTYSRIQAKPITISDADLALLAKAAREFSGKTKSQTAAELNIAFSSVFNAEEKPERSLAKIRKEIIERYTDLKVAGPAYQLFCGGDIFGDLTKAHLEEQRTFISSKILAEIFITLDIQAGMLHCENKETDGLLCVAHHDRAMRSTGHELSYRFHEQSLATTVWKEKKRYFSPDPYGDGIINPRGLRQFQVKGPITGVPIMDRQKMLGVFVVWGQNNNEAMINRVEAAARLLKASIENLLRMG
jgi:hypothetical protein